MTLITYLKSLKRPLCNILPLLLAPVNVRVPRPAATPLFQRVQLIFFSFRDEFDCAVRHIANVPNQPEFPRLLPRAPSETDALHETMNCERETFHIFFEPLNYDTPTVIARSESSSDEAIPLSWQITMRLLRPDKNRDSQ